MERVTGVEPAPPAWKAGALPLSYTRQLRATVAARERRAPEPEKHPGMMPQPWWSGRGWGGANP